MAKARNSAARTITRRLLSWVTMFHPTFTASSVTATTRVARGSHRGGLGCRQYLGSGTAARSLIPLPASDPGRAPEAQERYPSTRGPPARHSAQAVEQLRP